MTLPSFHVESLESRIGEEIAVSDWIELPQSMIDAFAEVTRDRQWIHIDVERAQRESPYRAPIAHGFLVLSLIPHLAQQSYRVEGIRASINYGLNRVRFVAPVPAGSRLRARFALGQMVRFDGGFQVTWTVTLDIEGQPRPACVADTVARWLS